MGFDHERLGIAAELRAQRDAVLSTARMSREARARALGLTFHRPVAKEHRIVVDIQAATRTVETIGPTASVKPPWEPPPKKRLGLGPRSGLSQRVSQVTDAFCKAFDVERARIFSPERIRKSVRPRQAILHFLNVELELSLTPISKMFGRDHTTVLYARQKVKELLICDADFRQQYHRAARAIRSLWAER